MIAHSYEAVRTDPDCTHMGYTTYTCSVCGDSYKADFVDAAGHDCEATVVAPTCEATATRRTTASTATTPTSARSVSRSAMMTS